MHSGVTVLVAKLWLDRSASPIGNDTHQVAPRQRPERSGLGAPECETGENNCDKPESTECTNSEGSFSCQCRQSKVADPRVLHLVERSDEHNELALPTIHPRGCDLDAYPEEQLKTSACKISVYYYIVADRCLHRNLKH